MTDSSFRQRNQKNNMHILAFNAGSSSLKFQLIEMYSELVIASGGAQWSSSIPRYSFSSLESNSIDEEVDRLDIRSAANRAIADIQNRTDCNIDAIAHRVVHGGTQFTNPVVITEAVSASLRELVMLAPLHNGCSLEGVAAASQAFPDVPQIAVFDTSFHQTLSPEAYVYPVPFDWTAKWKIRRFGFHGLSHEYCASRAAEILDIPLADLRLIIAHLGHGVSLAAIRDGKSIDTTMGFTPLDGPMMATRSGSIDPGIVLHVQRQYGLSVKEFNDTLNHYSGLQGVSGISADMREIQRAAESGNERATLAIAMYVHSLRKAIGAMAATLGGLDALVFTGGVGENSATIREAACDGLAFLGLELDPVENSSARTDAFVSKVDSQANILIVATNEELTLCRSANNLMMNQRVKKG